VKIATISIRMLADYSVGLKDCQQPAAGATRDPIEGTQHPQALYLSLSQEVFITSPPPPPGGVVPSHPGSPNRDYLGTMHEIARSGFVSGGNYSCLVLWRGTFSHDGSHPPTVTQAPLRS
jgi:hypothetical protein